MSSTPVAGGAAAGGGTTGGAPAAGSGRNASWLPGVAVAAGAALLAFGVHLALPAVPLLTIAVLLGVVLGQIPAARRYLDGVLKPGLGIASRRLLRIGIVLLGLKLSLVDIAGLGWPTIGVIVAIVTLTFFATFALGRLMRLPGTQPILIAAGFSICGASAIGAMSAVTRSKDDDAATSVALVTLCGTLAIAVLPALSVPLGMTPEEFGLWVGLSVHDVGQVVATAQIAGPAALAVAVVVKLTRVLTLAPMVAAVGLLQRRADARAAHEVDARAGGEVDARAGGEVDAQAGGVRDARAASTTDAGDAGAAGAAGAGAMGAGDAGAMGAGGAGSMGAGGAGAVGAGGAPTVGSAGRPGRPGRPAIVPLFVVGFVAAVLVRTFLLPLLGGETAAAGNAGGGGAGVILEEADVLQTALFGAALFALGTSIRFAQLARTGWRAAVVGLISWALIAVLSLGAVELLT
ncbi:YeiH family protein [Herbiconiux sp. P15]|uniref:YeiH family protein n=1 Tax=Herbiconiux liukaitaii TaxID=3342799 RepID=UPI0035B7CF28